MRGSKTSPSARRTRSPERGEVMREHAISSREVSPEPERHEVEDMDEHWWTPLPRKLLAVPPQRPALSNAAYEEVSSELDRVLNLCGDVIPHRDSLNLDLSSLSAHSFRGGGGGRHHSAGLPRREYSPNPFGMTAEESDSHGAATPSCRSMSRTSCDGPVALELSRNSSNPGGAGRHGDAPDRPPSTTHVRKSNIHGPMAGSRANAGSRSTSNDAGLVGRDANSRRRKKRHRLLGPQKGLAVHFGHENWNMVLSMMIGIRMSVGRSKHEMHRELQPVDFTMKEKFSIVPRMVNIFDAAVSSKVQTTRFIDYAPLVFQKIRSSFHIDHDEYLRSVGPEQLLGNMVLGNLSSLAELSSEGKSGAFFYYTADGNYMMKTVTYKEYHLLRRMLQKYYEHITQNPGTLIVRFLGLHCLSVRKKAKGFAGVCGKLAASEDKLYFVVMANMFNTPFEIHRRYDLKGSWVGRQTSAEKYDPTVALKDVDFKNAKEGIRVGEERRSQLTEQIEKDSKFLASQNIIDYSLLLGIHDQGAEDAEEAGAFAGGRSVSTTLGVAAGSTLLGHLGGLQMGLNDGAASPAHSVYTTKSNDALHGLGEVGGGILSPDKRSLYFIGIIDILTPYDGFKKLEHGFKAMRYDHRGVSCCPPPFYAERFNSFMKTAFV